MSTCGVMLGILDEEIPLVDDDRVGWMTNKIGGSPNWMNETPHIYPQCDICGKDLPLIIQIYCPLLNSQYHRVLYVFGCTNIPCWNKNESWKVLRGEVVSEQKNIKNEEIVNSQETKTNSWCDDSDDWGEHEEIDVNMTTEITDLENQTRNLELTSKEQNNISSFSQTYPNKTTPKVYFKPYFVTVLNEYDFNSHTTKMTLSEKHLLDEYRKREGLKDFTEIENNFVGAKWQGEKYETSCAKPEDKIFQKFKKKLTLCPEQCIRYKWDGKPLPMTSQSIGTIPACNTCGRERVFELQLMPALVSHLTIEKDNSAMYLNNEDLNEHNCTANEQDIFSWQRNVNSASIEFGMVFVYTCSKSCWEEGRSYQQEYILVQSYPDQYLFRDLQ